MLRYEYLPAPANVLSSLAELARSGELFDDVTHTLVMTSIATVTALTLGAVLGVALGLLPTIRSNVVGID